MKRLEALHLGDEDPREMLHMPRLSATELTSPVHPGDPLLPHEGDTESDTVGAVEGGACRFMPASSSLALWTLVS